MAKTPIAGAPNGAELPARAARSDEEAFPIGGVEEEFYEDDGAEEEEEDNEDQESGTDEGGDWDVSSVFDEWLAQSTDPVVFGPGEFTTLVWALCADWIADRSLFGGVVCAIEDDAVTAEEGRKLRDLLRSVGEARFIEETLHAGAFTAKKLLTAFGVRPVCSTLLGRLPEESD